MSYTVLFAKSAQRQLEDLPDPFRKTIRAHIDRQGGQFQRSRGGLVSGQ